MGSFASGFLLFGIALVYGATGTFDLLQMRAQISTLGVSGLPPYFYVGVILILIAMGFKVSVAPFHFWAPDVYDGSPTVITAFMSTVVKTAAFAAFMRLFLVGFSGVNTTWSSLMAIMIALSLVIANFTAATQNSVKRMLAYSSISHAAFMLMGILAINNQMSVQAILYYTLAYSIGSISAFTVLNAVSKNGDVRFEAFHGLGKRNPLLAVCMVVSVLSLAGIPLTSGFFAKYYVFTSLISSNYKWLLILAVLTSAVGVYYYFKVIIAMYFKNTNNEEPLVLENSGKFVLLLSTLLTILLGLIPGYVIEMFSNA
jgi:NADH-quinone oxidoreductase subunit N